MSKTFKCPHCEENLPIQHLILKCPSCAETLPDNLRKEIEDTYFTNTKKYQSILDEDNKKKDVVIKNEDNKVIEEKMETDYPLKSTEIQNLEKEYNRLYEDVKKLKDHLNNCLWLSRKHLQELEFIEDSKRIDPRTTYIIWHQFKKNNLPSIISFYDSYKFVPLTNANQAKRAMSLYTKYLEFRNEEGDNLHSNDYREIQKMQEDIGEMQEDINELLLKIDNNFNNYMNALKRLSSDETITKPYQENKSFWERLFG